MDEQTNRRMDKWTDERPRSNMPLQILRSWGHKNYAQICANADANEDTDVDTDADRDRHPCQRLGDNISSPGT